MAEERSLDLDYEMVPLKELKPAKYNPRRGLSLKERLALRRSIEEYGMVYPIVVNKRNNVVVGGHQRLKELLDMGQEEAPVLWVDMDDEQEKRANIQLNAIEADFDPEKLQELVYPKMPSDVENMGFTAVEARTLLAGIFMNAENKKRLFEELAEEADGEEEEEPKAQEDEPMYTCPKCGYKALRSDFLNNPPSEEETPLKTDENGSQDEETEEE